MSELTSWSPWSADRRGAAQRRSRLRRWRVEIERGHPEREHDLRAVQPLRGPEADQLTGGVEQHRVEHERGGVVVAQHPVARQRLQPCGGSACGDRVDGGDALPDRLMEHRLAVELLPDPSDPARRRAAAAAVAPALARARSRAARSLRSPARVGRRRRFPSARRGRAAVAPSCASSRRACSWTVVGRSPTANQRAARTSRRPVTTSSGSRQAPASASISMLIASGITASAVSCGSVRLTARPSVWWRRYRSRSRSSTRLVSELGLVGPLQDRPEQRAPRLLEQDRRGTAEIGVHHLGAGLQEPLHRLQVPVDHRVDRRRRSGGSGRTAAGVANACRGRGRAARWTGRRWRGASVARGGRWTARARRHRPDGSSPRWTGEIIGQRVDSGIFGPNDAAGGSGVRQSTASIARCSNRYPASSSTSWAASIPATWLSWVTPERRRLSAATAQNSRPRRMSCTNVVMFPRGPDSRNTRAPSSCSASIVSRNRTGLVQCSTISSRICCGSSG